MARSRFDDIKFDDDAVVDFSSSDFGDQAFWDEFWRLEVASSDKTPLVTITIKNEETGEEKVIRNVRLKFRSAKKLRG